MKKAFLKLKTMTGLFALVIGTSLATFTSCKSYDDDISNLQSQVTAVVNDVATLKTSVAALQSSVNGMTYIKSITMGTDGKLTITPSAGSAIVYDATQYVKYTISLSSDGKLTVNGASAGQVTIPALSFGSDGKLMSGSTVVADLTTFLKNGLTVGADNYLYVNGQKTSVLIPAAYVAQTTVKLVTVTGNKITFTYTDGTTKDYTPADTPIVATTGPNGDLFINGVDTKVVVTNTFAVANGFLTVNGVATTVKIPDATKNVVLLNKDSNGNIISTTITDSTGATATIKVNPASEPLAGLLFVPSVVNNGVNAIELGYINAVNPLLGKSLFTAPGATYRLNPTTTDITKISAWNIVTNSAVFNSTAYYVKGQRAPGDSYTLFTPTLVPNSRNDGSQDFKLKVGTWVEPATGSNYTVALEATYNDVFSGNATKIVSDYAKVLPVQFTAFVTKAATSPFVHYPTAAPVITATEDYQIVYNAQTLTNVNNLVVPTAVKAMTSVEKTLADYNFGTLGTDYKFKFTVPAGNIGPDGVTDDNSFITVDASGNITVKGGTSAIGRRPYVYVELQNASGTDIAVGYIKFSIVESATVPPTPFTFNVAPKTVNYQDLFVGQAVIGNNLTFMPVSWTDMNTIYASLGVSHDKFNQYYAPVTPTVSAKFNGVALTGADLAAVTASNQFVTSTNAPGVDTYAMEYGISPMSKFGTYVVTYTYAPAGLSPLNINFTFTVNKPVLDKTILAGYQYNGSATTVMTQGMNTGGAFKMQLYLGEAFGYGSTALRNMFGTATVGKIDGATHQFVISEYPGAVIPSFAINPTGAQPTLNALLGTGTGTGTLMTLSNKITVDRSYPAIFRTNYPNGEKDDFNYTILFKNPITIELATGANFLLTDKIDGTADTKDISLNYVVKFLGQVIVNAGTTTTTGTTLGYTSAGLAYSAAALGTYQTYSLTAPSTIQWLNAGTALTSQVKVGTATVTYTTPDAIQTRTDDVNVKPGN